MAVTYTTGTPNSEGVHPILEPGEYTFRVVNATQKQSKAGNPMIEVEARHVQDDGSEGRKIYDNLVFTEKALWKVDQFLAAVGKHPGEGKEITLDAEDMIGLEFRAKVGVEKDNKDRDRNFVESYVFEEEEGF